MRLLCLSFGILLTSAKPLAVCEHTLKLRHVYLTWQHDPCRTVTINVHGIKTPAEIFVYYDTQPHFSKIAKYPHKVVGVGKNPLALPDGRLIYHIELPNLEPGQVYYFTLGDCMRAYGNELCFRTIPQEGEPLFFVEGGDWENTPIAAALAQKAASLHPMAVLLGGDYPSRVLGIGDYKKWDAWLDSYTRNMMTSEGRLIPMVMALGNHEVVQEFGQSKSHVPFFFHYFLQGDTKKSYFSLPFGKRVCLFVLDSGHVASHDGEQKEWLTQELQKTENVAVKMALYHVPLFPSVRFAEKDMMYLSVYGIVKLCKSRLTADKLFSKEGNLGRVHWLHLFDKYALTVAFEHHDQALKRTKLLRNGQEDPMGTLYLGDGGWGSELQISPIQGYFRNYFSSLQGNKHFFWTVKIDQETLTYEAITPSGEVIDRFVQNIKK